MFNLTHKTPKILVVGDLMIDTYLWGDCTRISPEAPVPVVVVRKETQNLGGGGNVVHNLSALGAEVLVSGVIGDDDDAMKLEKMLTDVGINTDFLARERERKTSKKTRLIATSQQIIRYDKESKHAISKVSEGIIKQHFKSCINKVDIVLFSDYGKGLFTHTLTQKLIQIANNAQKKVLIDPKGSDYIKYKNAYLLTPNKQELSAATGIDIKNKSHLKQAMAKIKKQCALNVSLATLSEEGIALLADDFHIYPTATKEVFDVTGAGDAVLAALGFALALGSGVNEALRFANIAAGVVVGKVGSASATLDEIMTYQSTLNSKKNTLEEKIVSKMQIKKIVHHLKSMDKKVIFTNGCFDLLHIGHIKYLQRAKTFGDVLIVGVNSDESVRKLKGKGRPIVGEDERAYLLAALDVIDFVVIFSDETPYDLIDNIRPNILVKGADYQNKKVVGAELAGTLKLVDFVKNKSSSKLIEKIRNDI